MTDPVLYLSMFLGLGGVYVLISSFHDDDDGEKYIYNLSTLIWQDSWYVYKITLSTKSFFQKNRLPRKYFLGVTEILTFF